MKTSPLLVSEIVLGIGLGGFLDGIVLHQLLQLHNMLTARIPKSSIVNMEINMFWDGMFHLFTWCTTVIGVWLLWRATVGKEVTQTGKSLVGALLFGWGLFNFVEGLIDHHILHAHHVVEALGLSIYDYAFLVSGIVFMGIGLIMLRNDKRPKQASF